MAAVQKWNQRPVVRLTRTPSHAIDWYDTPSTQAFPMGDSVEIQVETRYYDPYGGLAGFRIWVERYDADIGAWVLISGGYKNPVYTIDSTAPDRYEWHRNYHNFVIDLTENILTFRVRVSMMAGRHHNYTDPEERIFSAFVEYFGDFSLDYVPISIIYCPPGQDMTNSLQQTTQYLTNVGFGFSKEVGSIHTTGAEFTGGVKGTTGYVNVSGSVSTSTQTIDSETFGNAVTNIISFGYSWQTTVTADNQRAIGRRYWGPLGDIYVLLKNPWFSIRGDEEGKYLIEFSKTNAHRAELLFIPAHKLLRPGDDPVASRIPLESRRKLLELDPFITNLDDFFPEDKGEDLSHAVNAYQDPSVGNPATATGKNRAVKIARYSISNGVVIDYSLVRKIEFKNKNTNETEYYSEVTHADSGVMGLGFLFDAITLGLSGYSSTGKFTRLSYQLSNECAYGKILNATCKLIRNQNDADLGDIEIWWDKQFSTFMFRRVPNCVLVRRTVGDKVVYMCEGLTMLGSVTSPSTQALNNVEVTLSQVINNRVSKSNMHVTMTDEQGQFVFDNAQPGKYIISCGDKKQTVNITKRHLQQGLFNIEMKNVKRSVSFKTSPLWEIAAALNITPEEAKSLQFNLKKEKKLSRTKLTSAMRKLKLPVDRVGKDAILKYNT